jgi:cellobiose phosphorylase
LSEKFYNFWEAIIMKNAIIFILSIMLTACATKEQDNQELAKRILADQSMQRVDKMARDLMKKGFYAGSGYQMVWARDMNTFIELSCEEYDLKVLRENLLMFFHFQQENGELLDGYVPREGFNWEDPNTYESTTAPDHIGFKNTVETDQETSLIQALEKYISKTNDRSILDEKVAGTTVYQRLVFALEYLLNERYSEKYGLITGATTFDWGDVQVEGGTVVDIDELSHWSIDVYDNAMLVIALKNMEAFAGDTTEKQRWKELHSSIKSNIKKHLWDPGENKFIPHIYLSGSPFPDDFDENAIHYHGGTAIAIKLAS